MSGYTCLVYSATQSKEDIHIFYVSNSSCVGRHSSVGTANRLGMDGPGIESRWERNFPHPSRQALGPTQPTIQWVPGLSRG